MGNASLILGTENITVVGVVKYLKQFAQGRLWILVLGVVNGSAGCAPDQCDHITCLEQKFGLGGLEFGFCEDE